MRNAIAVFLLAAFSCEAGAVTIPTVYVGDIGNPNNPADGDQVAAGIQNYGAVNYAYRISTYEVTNAQYVEFLNAKASTNLLGLYDQGMTSDPRGGILRSGADGHYTYETKPNMADKPVNYVNWYDAIRFANWLNNGQGAGSTETGAYTILDGGKLFPGDGPSIVRNAGATWFLPSENEWYKAAYYQPAEEGGDADGYWLYATATNIAPAIATANSTGEISNPGLNVANYFYGADWNSQNGNVTTVGSAGPMSQSFYGTFDQAGNVYEWTEAIETVGGPRRGLRGGGWSNADPDYLASTWRSFGNAVDNDAYRGFRVATIPEPSTAVLAAFACGMVLLFRRWFSGSQRGQH